MKTEITTTTDTPVAPLIAVIERAAKDPTVDVDKMERLFALQERLYDRQAEAEANADFSRFKQICPSIVRGRSGDRNKWHYAAYEDLMRVIRPHMDACGFVERFETSQTTSGAIASVTCTIVHRAGHSWKSTFPVLADKSGSKNDIQAIGSAVSYGKRYSLGQALGLVFVGEDDDGHGTVAKSTPEEEFRVRAAPAKVDRSEIIGHIEARMYASEIDEETLQAIIGSIQPKIANTPLAEHSDATLEWLASDKGWDKIVKTAKMIGGAA